MAVIEKKTIDELIERILEFNPKADIKLVKSAHNYSKDFYRDKLAPSGTPSFDHSFEVASTLADLKMDSETIAAGFLHNILNETEDISKDDIKEEFGSIIADIVEGISKVNKLNFQKKGEQQLDTFRKMLLSVAKDIRVIVIKFADRLQELRNVNHYNESVQLQMAHEALNIYAPLAHRFGIAAVKSELEDLALFVINLEEYKTIEDRVKSSRKVREKYINEVIEPIKKELDRVGITYQIKGRAKHIYSIYRKSIRKDLPVEDMHDIIAIRIITEKIEDCYFALGIVHSLFTPVPEQFKDYIATPKPNGYQSIHTTILGGTLGRMVEVQIRTFNMHKTAEYGIAAHWKYKEGKVESDELDKYISWLRQMIEDENADPEAIFEDLQLPLYQDEVFVFTPKGDLIKLPKGATSLDFAFAIHTGVGINCIGSKVNGKIVPLRYKLKSGDIVEILTSPNQTPNRDWLNIVTTSKAQSNIKRWFRDIFKEQSRKLGEEMLTKELKKAGKKIKSDLLHNGLEKLLPEYGFKEIDTIFSSIGSGKISASSIIEKLFPEEDKEKRIVTTISKVIDKVKKSDKGISVAGEENMMITFAKCCQPLPGDDIFGYVSSGRGVTVHRKDCSNAPRLLTEEERIIDVNWDVPEGRVFTAGIKIIAEDRKNLLKDIIDTISATETNIIKSNLKVEESLLTQGVILEVKNTNHLNKVIKRIKSISGVLTVKRLHGKKQ